MIYMLHQQNNMGITRSTDRKIRNAHKISVVKPEGQKKLLKPRCGSDAFFI
jgi:hypothetical protein